MSNTCPHNVVNFGPLVAEIDPVVWGTLQILTGFASWQRYCMASSSGCQPNLAALKRGCHLYSTGRPSRWALAHILVSSISACPQICESLSCFAGISVFEIWRMFDVCFVCCTGSHEVSQWLSLLATNREISQQNVASKHLWGMLVLLTQLLLSAVYFSIIFYTVLFTLAVKGNQFVVLVFLPNSWLAADGTLMEKLDSTMTCRSFFEMWTVCSPIFGRPFVRRFAFALCCWTIVCPVSLSLLSVCDIGAL